MAVDEGHQRRPHASTIINPSVVGCAGGARAIPVGKLSSILDTYAFSQRTISFFTLSGSEAKSKWSQVCACSWVSWDQSVTKRIIYNRRIGVTVTTVRTIDGLLWTVMGLKRNRRQVNERNSWQRISKDLSVTLSVINCVSRVSCLAKVCWKWLLVQPTDLVSSYDMRDKHDLFGNYTVIFGGCVKLRLPNGSPFSVCKDWTNLVCLCITNSNNNKNSSNFAPMDAHGSTFFGYGSIGQKVNCWHIPTLIVEAHRH